MRLLHNLARAVASSAYYAANWCRVSLQGVRLLAGARISWGADVREASFLGRVTIARGVVIGRGSYINSGEVHSGTIGRWCSIGYNVVIGPDEHDLASIAISSGLPARAAGQATFEQPPPPVLGDDVWVGANVVILRGVRVGDGSVIAAGAIVTSDVAPFTVVGGVPARLIRHRFDSPDARARAVEFLSRQR